ncbi:MAG: hypothetical protein J0H29_21265 [Sphingobacteriales bacterium]|nr:hypothetical protein [Sphingobacteriales bacterium]
MADGYLSRSNRPFVIPGINFYLEQCFIIQASTIFSVHTMEKDQLFNFRQPLVTAAGIILGFVLNFATELVKRDTRSDVIPLLILFFTLIGISLLIVSLYRILYNDYDRVHADRFYRRTLNYFMTGVIFSFLGGLLKMVHTLFLS